MSIIDEQPPSSTNSTPPSSLFHRRKSHAKASKGGKGGRGGLSLVFLLNLNKWMLWCPVWLPMIFVITPPLSEYCNIRTGIFIVMLCAIRWNTGYWRHWRHLLKNASWGDWLYAILVPRLWPTRIERYCDECEFRLSKHLASSDQQLVGWKLRCLRRFPWRIWSRHWGNLTHTKLRPHFLNTLLIYVYARAFKCKVHEAVVEDIGRYDTLGAFFVRKLKDGARPCEGVASVVSPADGMSTFVGSFDGGFLEQVKGVHYSLPYFLGFPGAPVVHGASDKVIPLMRRQDGSTQLYQAVIYLSPGDYHRFHSPANWTVHTRRHFPGELLSVKPSVVSSCPGMFHLNERVSWLGEWEHGFFSMTAVGALNVGSIHLEDPSVDPELQTNQSFGLKRRCDRANPCSTRPFYYSEKRYDGAEFGKGQPFGYFTFGSTIVLIFEAPATAAFTKNSGQRLVVGQSLFSQ